MTEPPESGPNRPRDFTWIWFLGFAAWALDGTFWLRLHAAPHAKLAFMLALLFLVVGIFFRSQRR